MRKIFGRIWFTLAMACLAQAAYSQGTISLASLNVFTNGQGSITPYQSGQMLQVGLSYELTATPDPGYQFSSWQPVDIFTITQTNYDAAGDPILPPSQSIVLSVVQSNIYTANLEFTMQGPVMISAPGSDPNTFEAFGWQANFDPVPEPAEAAMFGCGLAAMALVPRCLRLRRGRLPNRSRCQSADG